MEANHGDIEEKGYSQEEACSDKNGPGSEDHGEDVFSARKTAQGHSAGPHGQMRPKQGWRLYLLSDDQESNT